MQVTDMAGTAARSKRAPTRGVERVLHHIQQPIIFVEHNDVEKRLHFIIFSLVTKSLMTGKSNCEFKSIKKV
jgi:hypothetical protein